VKATFDDRDAIVHVEDTGKGIAPEMLPRVLDLFTQADAVARRLGASREPGLGNGQRVHSALAAAKPGAGGTCIAIARSLQKMQVRIVMVAAAMLLVLTGCARKNEPAARDAAPGPLSETQPPSTPPGDPHQQTAPDSTEDPPRK
jgi:hypothetical protein